MKTLARTQDVPPARSARSTPRLGAQAGRQELTADPPCGRHRQAVRNASFAGQHRRHVLRHRQHVHAPRLLSLRRTTGRHSRPVRLPRESFRRDYRQRWWADRRRDPCVRIRCRSSATRSRSRPRALVGSDSSAQAELPAGSASELGHRENSGHLSVNLPSHRDHAAALARRRAEHVYRAAELARFRAR